MEFPDVSSFPCLPLTADMEDGSLEIGCIIS